MLLGVCPQCTPPHIARIPPRIPLPYTFSGYLPLVYPAHPAHIAHITRIPARIPLPSTFSGCLPLVYPRTYRTRHTHACAHVGVHMQRVWCVGRGRDFLVFAHCSPVSLAMMPGPAFEGRAGSADTSPPTPSTPSTSMASPTAGEAAIATPAGAAAPSAPSAPPTPPALPALLLIPAPTAATAAAAAGLSGTAAASPLRVRV